jgi:hypothetical protein
MNEKEQKVLELKATIFDVIRKQELFQAKEMVKNQDFDLKGVPVQEVKE